MTPASRDNHNYGPSRRVYLMDTVHGIPLASALRQTITHAIA
jgi:hypothetical protein